MRSKLLWYLFTCNTYICSSCQSHYFFEGEICSKWDYNCKECITTSTNCTSCNTGKYLNNSQCLPCNSNCYECENSPGHCTACETGKYLSYSLCNPCSSNCKTCETKSTNCLSCYDGKYLSNSQCLQCDSNCKTCKNSATYCLSCNMGYYLSLNKWEKCPNICQVCKNENKCTSCIDDYFLYNDHCYQCNVSCKTTSDGCKCDTCEDGYYLNNYQCLQCDFFCKTCIQQDLCTQCIPDYYKKEVDHLNSGQSFKCYKDLEKYYLDNDMYKQCYQSCNLCNIGGNKTFHNCLDCELGLSFELKRNEYINCYEDCSNFYYFDSGDNFLCTSDKSCPDDYPYLLENKFECIEIILDDILDYLLGNGLNGTESKEEQIIFYDNILINLEDGFTSETYNTSDLDNGIDQILKAEKLTITFTHKIKKIIQIIIWLL